MAIQLSDAVRNARLDAVETTVGTSPKLQLRTGAQPATCATANAGTMLAELTLPSDWMAAASGGSKAKTGSWTGTAAAAGVAAHFRVQNTAGSTCHIQGSVSDTGGGGDMTLDNDDIGVGQTITVNTFTLTDANP